jgi:hypothetical protein
MHCFFNSDGRMNENLIRDSLKRENDALVALHSFYFSITRDYFSNLY